MAYLPLKSARRLYALKNGQLLESGITLDFMLIPSQFSDEFSQKLTGGSYTGIKSMNYYSDSRYPSVDNPTIIKSYLSTFRTFAAASSPLCKSTYLFDLLTNVGDEVIIYNMDTGSGYGFGWQYAQYSAPLKILYPVAIINGTKYVGVGIPQSIGIASGNEARAMAWGVMIDKTTKEGAIYIARASYHTPENYYDSGSVIPCEVRGMAEMKLLVKSLFFDLPPEPVPDPYNPGGTSETQEPNGSFDDTSDTISVPSTPALNLALSNFMSAYSPNITKINELANFIWGDYSGLDRHIAKFFADPTDAIISLHMVPFTPSTSSDVEVTVGKYGTGISMPPITTQFKDVDCGSLTIEPYWDNYLDYNPYTRLTLVLPYVGEVQLDPDEVMGQTVSVLYRVDVLSGAFVCFVSTATKILAQYTGCCILTVPISSASYAAANAAIMRLAISAVGLGTGAVGYSAAMEGGVAKEIKQAKAGLMDAAGNAGSSAMSVVNAKVNHSHSGSIAGTAGFLGRQKPYLLIHRARQSVPEDANRYYGYPCNVTFKLEDLTGFTKIKNIVMDDLPFTRGEIEDLRAILAAGVYL